MNPVLIRITRASEYDIDRSLVIAGFPRSGTTWLAEVVATLPGTAVLFEPLDYRTIPAARQAGLSWDNFRLPEESWPEGERYLRRVLSGRVLTRQTTSHIPVRRAVGVSRWIVKFVRANPMLGWLVENLNIRPPVLLVRHPCAVFSSWVSRGWPLVTYSLPERLRFFKHYPEHKDWIRSLSRPEEIFAAQWGMHHLAAFDHMRGRSYYLCVYESLLKNGLDEIAAIFSHWNLNCSEDFGPALRHPSAKASDTLKTNSTNQLEGWCRRLDEKVVERMIYVLNGLGLDFYSHDPEVDFAKLSEIAGTHVGR